MSTLRKCYYTPHNGEREECTFHNFGTRKVTDEGNSVIGLETVAIIEFKDGQLFSADPNRVKFIS